LLNSKKTYRKSQEANPLLELAKEQPLTDIMTGGDNIKFVWQFLIFLKHKKKHIVDANTIYCISSSHLVDYSKLL